MNLLVILSAFFFAYAQATSEPITIQKRAAIALHECAQEKKLDEKHIASFFKNDILPEDNAEFTDFFACYWKKSGAIKQDDTFDHLYMKVMFPYLIKDKYPNISNADKIADDAVEHCKDIPQAESIGLTGIKYRNCLTQYVKDRQQ